MSATVTCDAIIKEKIFQELKDKLIPIVHSHNVESAEYIFDEETMVVSTSDDIAVEFPVGEVFGFDLWGYQRSIVDLFKSIKSDYPSTAIHGIVFINDKYEGYQQGFEFDCDSQDTKLTVSDYFNGNEDEEGETEFGE